MTSDPTTFPSIPLKRITAVLEAHGVVEFAFTGGLAVGVWSAPRQTRDVDICGSLPLDQVDRLLAQRDGIRSGTEELPDIVRFRVLDWDVDLFVAKGPYDRECLRRAVSVTVDGVTVRVVTVEDLVIHKAMKLRYDRRRLIQDLADIRALVEAGESRIDWDYVAKWVLPDEFGWLKAVASSSEEDLVRRFLNS